MLTKYRVTIDNMMGDHLIGKTTLMFDAESFNSWLDDIADMTATGMRFVGATVPTFSVETLSTQEGKWRLLMS